MKTTRGKISANARRFANLALTPLLFGIILIGFGCSRRNEVTKSTRFPEELVYARAKDDIINGGAMFVPPKDSAKPVAIIWIHGWGVNFYSPTYVNIGRALAERGYTCIVGNTRMHDLGNVAGYRAGKRIRGGGYWGVSSEEMRDVAAWVDFAGERGFQKVVLVGHSAGWAAVRHYQSQTQDPRVIGVVLASGAVRAETRNTDPDQLAEATRLMVEGRGEDIVRDPKRSFPSFVSAATFLDIANTPAGQKDFFGMQTPNPDVTRMRCPLLAFFGNRDDVGNESDLEKLKAAIKRQQTGPASVETTIIRGADHMYGGEEAQVADTIARWTGALLSGGTDGGKK